MSGDKNSANHAAYLVQSEDGYRMVGQPTDGVIAQLLPPMVEEHGAQMEAAAAGFSHRDRVHDMGGGLFRITRSVSNESRASRTVKLMVVVKTSFAATKYLMPCILYDGNRWGDGNSPKGLTHMGEPWVFAYDRMGIPSCTLTECAEVGVALFASDVDECSLRTSASLVRMEHGGYMHRIHYPVTEAPVTYSGKNKMTARYDEYITLTPGEVFTATFYLFACMPRWKHFACANLLDAIGRAFPYQKNPRFTPRRVWELGIHYLKRLMYQWQGHELIIAGIDTKLSHVQASSRGAGLTPEEMQKLCDDPEYNTYGFNRVIFEIGWAGQGFQAARMMMIEALQTGDAKLLSRLMAIQQVWVDRQMENGMILPHFERYADLENSKQAGADAVLCQGWLPETCNLGWGASEMAKMYMLLRDSGIEKPEYLRFATRICDFFVAHFSQAHGFGKLWSLDGEMLDATGSVGGFILIGLMDTYRATGNRAYLDMAMRGMDFYGARDVDHFICTAGAIDCVSVDKETAFPFVITALDLYDEMGDEKYLCYAKKAAYYFMSWTFQYDALYPQDSDFAQHGYSTQGGTAISAEHHAIDPWGSLLVPEFVRLWKHTGEMQWLVWARMMWNQSQLGIAAEEGYMVHGLARPLGSQNEGFFQARWTKYRMHCEERGHFNDWLVSWVSVYRLTALDRLTRVCGETDWELFA